MRALFPIRDLVFRLTNSAGCEIPHGHFQPRKKFSPRKTSTMDTCPIISGIGVSTGMRVTAMLSAAPYRIRTMLLMLSAGHCLFTRTKDEKHFGKYGRKCAVTLHPTSVYLISIKTAFTKHTHGATQPGRNGVRAFSISTRYLKFSGMRAAEPMPRMGQAPRKTCSWLKPFVMR